MISFYFTVPFLLFLAMLETTLSPYVRPLGVHPDLVTLAVLSWSLLRGTREGAVWAVIGGMGLDLLSAGPIPPMTAQTAPSRVPRNRLQLRTARVTRSGWTPRGRT